MTTIRYNPLDPEIRANPYPTYARLREEAPLYRIPGLGPIAVSRYEDVHRVLEDPRSFSSTAMRDLFATGSAASGGDGELSCCGQTMEQKK